jgi:hypothetical protein
MPRKLRAVSDLAAEVGDIKKARKILFNAGIKPVADYFDQSRLDIAVNEPQWHRSRNKAWSLSSKAGLGAMKYMLDPLKIDIMSHECKRSQWLTLQGPNRSRSYVKVHYKGKGSYDGAAFQLRGFLYEDAPEYYFLICFEGPWAWVVSRSKCRSIWTKLKKHNKTEEGPFWIIDPKHPGGHLGMYFQSNNKSYNLTLKRLGL